MASRTTRRVSDGTVVDFKAAQRDWANAARPVLERELPTGGGSPTLTKQLRAKRAHTRVPKVERAPRRQCPNCFVEVAASGVCGICGE